MPEEYPTPRPEDTGLISRFLAAHGEAGLNALNAMFGRAVLGRPIEFDTDSQQWKASDGDGYLYALPDFFNNPYYSDDLVRYTMGTTGSNIGIRPKSGRFEVDITWDVYDGRRLTRKLHPKTSALNLHRALSTLAGLVYLADCCCVRPGQPFLGEQATVELESWLPAGARANPVLETEEI